MAVPVVGLALWAGLAWFGAERLGLEPVEPLRGTLKWVQLSKECSAAGNEPLATSSAYALAASSMTPCRSA